MSDAREPSGFSRVDVRGDARQALALVHGVSVPKTPTLGLLALILELGIPAAADREQLLAAKLAENTE
jgi:hypothetical protein